ncbi:MAG: DUF1292 domain-containing protein [Clostridia bacterium]|nr:DUF1292 domain-containing protein [Clostridia bacterium]MBR5265380.1 DUF1292 domain-containing protein [Clostridia bacterium]
MENEFGNNIYTLTDEDGNEIALEHLDTYEIGDETYMAFLPANADDLDEYELLVLKIEHDEESDEDILVSIEDEEEEQKIFDIFAERLENMFEDEEEDEE